MSALGSSSGLSWKDYVLISEGVVFTVALIFGLIRTCVKRFDSLKGRVSILEKEVTSLRDQAIFGDIFYPGEVGFGDNVIKFPTGDDLI